jgi:hypothetical protein
MVLERPVSTQGLYGAGTNGLLARNMRAQKLA